MNSENINELLTALSKAQGKMTAASKDSSNPFYKSKYADLNSIWSACREALSENGLSVVQTMHKEESGQLYMKTTLGHSSGQWMASMLPIVPAKDGSKNELQALGSTLTYLRRYMLAAIVGVAPDEESDDDGNRAGGQYKLNQGKVAQAVAVPNDIDKTEALSQLACFKGDSILILMFLQERCGRFKTLLQDEVSSFLSSGDLAFAEFSMWKEKNVVQTPGKK